MNLKPCPFCDGPAKMHTFGTMTDKTEAFVQCRNCWQESAPAISRSRHSAKTIAAATWNKRIRARLQPKQSL